MPSTALHDLHQALEKLNDAFYEDKVTYQELMETATELTLEWTKIEEAKKATLQARVKEVVKPRYCPAIVVEKDYEGYFEALVRAWCEAKTTPWKCDTIVVKAIPFLPDAVQCWYNKDKPASKDASQDKPALKTLHIQFYSALRRDFGMLTKEDAQAIIDQWM